MTDAISVKNLWKQYRLGQSKKLTEALPLWWTGAKPKTFWALKNLNFQIRKGEQVGIIGPNGSGKSTLLKILAGVTFATKGKAEIYGKVASLLELGTGFHADLSGRENIYLYGALLGMKKNYVEQKFADIVNFSGLDKFIDTPVKFYSSGMYVRLAFSVAVQMEPDILLIDEALSVGDAAFQEKSSSYLDALIKTEGKTILVVSHNLTILRKLCQRVLYLDAGELKYDGPVNQTIENYFSSLNFEQPNTRRSIISPHFRIKNVRSAQSGKVLKVNVEIETKKRFKDLLFGISINTLDGIRIVEWRSPLFTVLKPGFFQFSCQLPISNIRGGEYMVAVGARMKKGDNLDYLPKVLKLKLPAKKIEQKTWNQDFGGFLVLPVRWSSLRNV